MGSARQTTALQKRALLANKHWGLFFSNLPYRVTNLRSLRESPAAIDGPAKSSAAISAVDGAVTNNLLGDDLRQDLNFAI